ncbi:MAG: hypothetical protein ACOY82_10600 [Pseudomonadota bacterium]
MTAKDWLAEAKTWLSANRRIAVTFAMIGVAVIFVNVYRGYISRLDEEMVDAYYQKHINAMRRFDSNTLCNLMDKTYRSVDTAVSPEGTETVEYTKDSACYETDEAMRLMWAYAKEKKVEPELKYTIASVTLSEDRRRAEVQVRGSIKLGKEIDLEFVSTETLIRRWGQVRNIGGKSKTVVKR